MDGLSPKPFKEAALRAFPFDMLSVASEAAWELSPFIDDAYRQRSEAIDVGGQIIAVPRRLHFVGLSEAKVANLSAAARCLATRATDGYLRQHALRSVIDQRESWVAPYVVLLLGEYVLEIVEDIHAALPRLDSSLYAQFVRENRQTMQRLRAKATSYWDTYHRRCYPAKRDYPGLSALHALEEWAAWCLSAMGRERTRPLGHIADLA